MAREKTCKGCEAKKPIAEFVPSKRAKDGRLGYCRDCWSRKMKAGAQNRRISKSPKNPKSPKSPKAEKAGHLGDILGLANAALRHANVPGSMFVVTADDGDIYETESAQEAVLKAIEWLQDGYVVVVSEQVPLSVLVVRLLEQ